MPTRNDETRPENGIPQGGSFKSGGEPHPGAWTGGAGSEEGRYYGRALERMGVRRGERGPGEIGHGRGFAGGGEDDVRARVHHPMTVARPGSYSAGSYGESAVYGSSGEYLGGNLTGPGPGARGGRGFPGGGYAYNDRRGPEYRERSAAEEPPDFWERDTGRSEFRGGEGYDREYGRELGSSADRLGYTAMRTEARPRWHREPLAARDVMTHNPRTVQPATSLKDAAQLMRDEDTGIVPVVDGSGKLLGVLTDRDMVVRGFSGERVPGQMHVEELMSREVECVTPDESVHDVLALMGQHQVRRVPVVDRQDRLLGIVSLGDIANRADDDEALQDALHRISSRRSFWNRLFR